MANIILGRMPRWEHQLFERDDDLSHCRVCGGAEGSLPRMCPERRMTDEEQDLVYAGKLNFMDGPMTPPGWWVPKEQ